MYLHFSIFSLIQTSHSVQGSPSPPSHTSFVPSWWKVTFYYPTSTFSDLFPSSSRSSPCHPLPSPPSKSTPEFSLYSLLSLALSLPSLPCSKLLQILPSLSLVLLLLQLCPLVHSRGLVLLSDLLSLSILPISVLLILSSPGLVLPVRLSPSLLFRPVLHL